MDRGKILRLADNLLSNAIKFTPEERAIHVCTQRRDGKILIIVEDHGIGIEEENISKLLILILFPIEEPVRMESLRPGLA